MDKNAVGETDSQLLTLVRSLRGDDASINILADFLGYDVGKNPVVPNSFWSILFSRQVPEKDTGVIALLPTPNLNADTKTIEIRRLFKQVQALRDEMGVSFNVNIAGFVGDKRVVFFQYANGNRDIRLDINEETVTGDMYASNFELLKDRNVEVKESPFGIGTHTFSMDLVKIFKRRLTEHFLEMIKFYRKKLSELITESSIKNNLSPLLDNLTRFYLDRNDLNNLVQQESYTQALGTVVDTYMLRQIMYRFLAAYYGPDTFETSGISLGVGSGTLDDAIEQSVAIMQNNPDDTLLKKVANRHHVLRNDVSDGQLALDLFSDEEKRATSAVPHLDDTKKARLAGYFAKARKQFETVYSGDLFAGTVGLVTTKVDNHLTELYTDVVTKLWSDTSAKKYSFRYQDLPPEVLETQYEESMSESVQISLNKDGDPEVFYGDDVQQQKTQGAYYTDHRLVSYIIQHTVKPEFYDRFDKIKTALKSGDQKAVDNSIHNLLDLRIIDPTCGGGSFLRGAFQLLSQKQQVLAALPVPDTLRQKYPWLEDSEEGQYAWEKHVLHYMIYGVDIDYKAVTIASLTLTLTALEHHPKGKKLPALIGYNLIHQNSLMNLVPFNERNPAFKPYQKEIKELRALYIARQPGFEAQRVHIQEKLSALAEPVLGDQIPLLNVQSIELNMPTVFFNKDGEFLPGGGFECVVGNPPWEKWKPNSDEFFSRYDPTYLALGKAKPKKTRQTELFTKFPGLQERWQANQLMYETGSAYFLTTNEYHWQSWVVDGKKTSSDTNLYKISTERFFQLLQKNGRLGILVPDSLANSKGASGLRHLLFDHGKIGGFLSFENRKGIFKSVHRSTKFAVLLWQKTGSSMNRASTFPVFFYQQQLSALTDATKKMDYPVSEVYAKGDLYSLTETRTVEEFRLFQKITNKFKRFSVTRPFQLGTDFHRTNDTKYFLSKAEGNVPLYEGKSIDQFEVVKETSEYVTRNEAAKRTDNSFSHYRISLRATASSTNTRSLISTLMPPNTVATNKLYMQRDANMMAVKDRIYYVGLLNSFILDFVARQLITTDINLFFVDLLPIPTTTNISDANEIAMISYELLLHGSLRIPDYYELRSQFTSEKYKRATKTQLIAMLNARIAIDFGLTRDDLILLMSTFESANHKEDVRAEAQEIIDVYDNIKEGESRE